MIKDTKCRFTTGGPAFPVQDVGVHGDFGMSLRDWFAGMALQGWMANNNLGPIHPAENELHDYIARQSYAIAEAMIKVRGKS
jgi:hypothetical protein